MGQLCDYCGEQRSVVHCRSDDASLCLSCDRNVHSANALSKRHLRTLLCERCNSHAATVRCLEEKISLCQDCDGNGHGSSSSSSTHKRQRISCYSGCPSAVELSRIWSFILDFPSMDDSNNEQGTGLFSIDENCINKCWQYQDSKKTDSSATDIVDGADRFETWMESSSLPVSDPMSCSIDQTSGSVDSTAPKLGCPETEGLGQCEDNLFADFNVADLDLNFENYEQFFGGTLGNPEQLFDNGGLDSLFGMKNMSVADSNFLGENMAEGSSAQKTKVPLPASSNAVSADSIMSAKTEPISCYTPREAHSSLSLSFSGLTGESSGDYQDCGVTSMLHMGESPWYPPGTENSIPSGSRDDAVMRYKEKKKARKFEKKIRYASRKARADIRKRVKGRFVKAGDAYDYDPLCETKSC